MINQQYDFLGRAVRSRTRNGQNQFGAAGLNQLTGSFIKEREEKYTAGLQNLKEILKLFGPGFGKDIEQTALAGVEEDLISRGLGKTTRPVAASVGIKTEIEGMRRSKLADALAKIAQYTQQSAPTPSTVASTALGTMAQGLQARRFEQFNRPPFDFGVPQGYTGLLRR